MEKMDAFKGDKAKFLPKKTYKDKLTIGTGKDQIDLYYFGAGHTNGDTFVVFPALRTMHAGDMFPWKDAPFIDRNNGGSGVEWPKTLAKVLGGVKNVDTVIGGHQPVATWKDLQTYQQYTADLLAQSEAAMKAGKSVDDATASFNFAKYPGFESTRLKAAVQAIYDELGGETARLVPGGRRWCNRCLWKRPVGPGHSSTKLTYADLELSPDDGLRHEIIDGVHYVTASPVTRHQRISLNC